MIEIQNDEITVNEFFALTEDMQFKELCAYYGRLMYAYQCLEHEIVNILVLAQTNFTKEQAKNFSFKMDTSLKKHLVN